MRILFLTALLICFGCGVPSGDVVQFSCTWQGTRDGFVTGGQSDVWALDDLDACSLLVDDTHAVGGDVATCACSRVLF